MINMNVSADTKVPIYAITSTSIDNEFAAPIITFSKEEGIKTFIISVFKYASELIEKCSFSLSLEFKQLWREYDSLDSKSIDKMLNTIEGKEKINALLTAMSYSDNIKFIYINNNETININNICEFINGAVEDNTYKVFKHIKLWSSDQVMIATDMVN